jgi:hypothetical protein
MTDYIEERYEDTFSSVYAVLQELAQKDPEQTERHIRQTLKSLYIRQGNDWTGRGAIGNAGLDASVAAHESVLAELAFHSENTKGDTP